MSENVERLIWIDCWSPMSASTWSNTGSAALSAGGRSPAWCRRTRQPERLQRDGLAAGVRPADHERAERSEVEVDRDGGGRVEQRMAGAEQPDLVGSLDRSAAPAPRDDPTRNDEVDRRRRLDERGHLVGGSPYPDGQLAQDALHLLALRARRFRLDGCSARRPRTARRRASGPSSTRRARCPGRCGAHSP